MKKRFSEQLLTTKEDDEDFENINKIWICYNAYVKGDVNIRYHCYINIKS